MLAKHKGKLQVLDDGKVIPTGDTGYAAILYANGEANVDAKDINTRDNYGRTALITSILSNRLDVVDRLIRDPQTKLNLPDHIGATPLIHSVACIDAFAFKALIHHPDIDVNAQTLHGCTALMRAAGLGKLEFVQLLLADPSIDVNLKNKKGDTALTIAVGSGNIDIVKAILKAPLIQVEEEVLEKVFAKMRTYNELGHMIAHRLSKRHGGYQGSLGGPGVQRTPASATLLPHSPLEEESSEHPLAKRQKTVA